MARESQEESQTTSTSSTSSTSSLTSPSSPVKMRLAYPNDRMEYGSGEKEVLTGNEVKEVSSSDAEKIRKAAKAHNMQIVEVKE